MCPNGSKPFGYRSRNQMIRSVLDYRTIQIPKLRKSSNWMFLVFKCFHVNVLFLDPNCILIFYDITCNYVHANKIVYRFRILNFSTVTIQKPDLSGIQMVINQTPIFKWSFTILFPEQFSNGPQAQTILHKRTTLLWLFSNKKQSRLVSSKTGQTCLVFEWSGICVPTSSSNGPFNFWTSPVFEWWLLVHCYSHTF
jgi:hypothetical protein